MMTPGALEFQRQAAAMPTGIAVTCQEVFEAFACPAGLEHELGGDVVGQVEDFRRFRQAKFARLQPERIGLGVVTDAVNLQVGVLFRFDHQPITQRQVK